MSVFSFSVLSCFLNTLKQTHYCYFLQIKYIYGTRLYILYMHSSDGCMEFLGRFSADDSSELCLHNVC